MPYRAATANEHTAFLSLPQEEEEEDRVGGYRRATEQESAQAEYDDSNAGQKIMTGVDQSMTELGHGVAGLFGDQFVTPDQERKLRIQRGIKGGWKTTGQVGAELATLAIPGGIIGKAASKGLPMALRASRAAPLLADTALLSGYEGLKAPEQGETRLDNATSGALASLGAGALAKGLAKVGRKVTGMTDEAAEAQGNLWMQEANHGMEITPGMKYGGFAEKAEEFATAIPGFGKKIVGTRAASHSADFPASEGVIGKIAESGLFKAGQKLSKSKLGGVAGLGALTAVGGPGAAVLGAAVRYGLINNSMRQRIVGLATHEQNTIINRILNALPAGTLPTLAGTITEEPSRYQISDEEREKEHLRALARQLRGK